MRHMLEGNNLGLITCRQQAQFGSEWNHCGISESIIESCAISNKSREINYLFPLYLYPSAQEIKQGLYEVGNRRPNLSTAFTADLAQRLSLDFVGVGRGHLGSRFGAEDVLNYIYAVLQSSSYRERYAQFLRADFPRVPPPSDVGQFRALAGLGRELIAINLLEHSALDNVNISFPVAGENMVEPRHPIYVPPGERPVAEIEPIDRGRVYIGGNGARRQYFEGIVPDVWEFRIGGYQPLKKWLQDRKGRELSYNDQLHYIRIAAALGESIRLIAEIDQIWVA